MTETHAELRRTPLEAEHRAAGAKMGAFAGWLMPIEYAGTLAEHAAVREAVGVFDVTHLGKIAVEGRGALETLQRSVTSDVSTAQPGQAQYGMVLDETGGIVDDLITYRVEQERCLVVPNAANVQKVREIIATHASGDVQVDVVDDLCLLAVQGPQSFDVVAEIFPEAPVLEYMHCGEMTYRERPMLVSRSGYTGERGFELFGPVDLAVDLWDEILERGKDYGIRPCGLAARDTLRLEMGYPLHGNDISPRTTPLQAGLSWAVAMGKGDFPGREALVRQRKEGVPSRLWGLRMTGKLIPRPHYGVFDGQQRVGETTSGTFSPTLRVGIALAYLAPEERFSAGDLVDVDVRSRRGQAELVSPPFVDRSPR